MYSDPLQNYSESEVITSDSRLSYSTICPSTYQFPSSCSISTPKNSTVPIVSGKKFTENENTSCETLYTKRRASKKQKTGSSSMEEVIEAVKQIASRPIILPQSVTQSEPAQDSINHFTAYLGAKLREMSPHRRTVLEAEIIKVLFVANLDNER
ncbi:hypothetical protein ALC57_05391 [Trachymyrmex cornetzi]|uniref:BESS domain-containing protein n=1 Tax=Trachymyrmex cornetzi TaxID=471704 RepID=A0A151JAW0_9HYME|nr:hypothetical protein ALC57_05391 [Trachymyrmex cornetzi]